MADLPEDWLEPTPPFSYSAVDYFGPWCVKDKRRVLKRYGVLFTCLTSRAIHLEVANSMDTDSFLNAYLRFVNRRGPVRHLRSDNGTNFVGAKNELQKALSEMDQDKGQVEMLMANCDWINFKMNAPHASHTGGVWERQIRTVRSVISAILDRHGSQLDDESLRKFMTEAEAIVNSRPVTVINSSCSPSIVPLTPNQLLTMKTKVVLLLPGVFEATDVYSIRHWRRVQHLSNEFWSRWKKDFLHSLQERQKWLKPHRNLEEDIVIIKDEQLPRNQWRLGHVKETYPGDDGLVKRGKVSIAEPNLDEKGKRTKPLSLLERPVQKSHSSALKK